MSRSILKPVIDKTKLSVRIDKGGCADIKPEDEAVKIGLITTAMGNAPSGIGLLNADGTVDDSLIPATVVNNYNPYLTIPDVLIAGNLYTFPINNYNTDTTYTVSVTGGTVELFNDTVKFRAPLISGIVTLTINERSIDLDVRDNYIVQPTIQAPTNYSSNVPAYTTITSSDFNLFDYSSKGNVYPPNGVISPQVHQYINKTETEILVSDSYANANGTRSGIVYVYHKINNVWILDYTIMPSDGANSDLGYYIDMDDSETHMAIAGRNKVYTYIKTNGVWVENSILNTLDTYRDDNSGRPKLNMSFDGTYLIVQASFVDYTILDSGSVYIYTRSGNTWTLQTTLTPPDPQSSAHFGVSVTIDETNTLLVIGEAYYDQGQANTGRVHIYTRSGTTWTLTQTITSDVLTLQETFGAAVVLNKAGNTLLVISRLGLYIYNVTPNTNTLIKKFTYGQNNIPSNINGSTLYMNKDFSSFILQDTTVTPNINYLFIYRNGEWFYDRQLPYSLIAFNKFNKYLLTVNYDIVELDIHQSSSWELATDPNFTNVVYNSPNDTANLTSWSVYDLLPNTDYYARVMYTGSLYGNSVWSEPIVFTTEQQFLPDVEVNKLIASDGAAGDWYGVGVALSGDGLWLAIGAYTDDNAQGTDAGKVYIYRRNGNGWTEVSTITEAIKGLGVRLSFNENGSKLVVGCYISSTYSSTYGHPKVFTYTLVNGIPTKVNEFLPDSTDTSPSYGTYPAISKDGLIMAVGLNSFDTNGIQNAGIVYIYDWNATNNTWTYRTSLQEPTVATSNYFGTKTSLNSDGSILAVSAIGNDTYGTNAGIVYIYDWNSVTSTYDLRTTVISSDIAASDYFGHSLSISSDGSMLVVGASLKDTAVDTDAGKVYIYQWNTITSTFDELYTLTASDAAAGDQFGIDVSITTNKDLLVVGARGNDNYNGTDAGAVYTFR